MRFLTNENLGQDAVKCKKKKKSPEKNLKTQQPKNKWYDAENSSINCYYFIL